MSSFVLPVLFTVFIWWFSTGLVLYLDRLSPSARIWGLVGLSAAAAGSFYGLVVASNGASILDVYLGFSFAIILWGWHEAAFLFGYIMGPRRTPCPVGVTGWKRFKFATGTLIYHEVALFVTLVALVVLTWGAANHIGAAAFGVLWVMRLSAKFNVFLGVPNLTEEFLPKQLEHLKSYFGRRSFNFLFPFSVVGITGIIVFLSMRAFAPEAAPFEVAGYLLLASLATLALIEHWLLVLPVRDAALWQWFSAASAEKPKAAKKLPPRRQPTTAGEAR